MTLRTFSYGGGVQSTAALVLAAEGKIDYPTFLFCNVGNDSEHPATLAYLDDHAMPYAAAHGIDLHVLRRIKRDGTVETLYGRLMKKHSRSIPIPMKMNGNGAPGTRSCTADFKIRLIAKWLKVHGATKDAPGLTGLGISRDEAHRARTDSGIPHQRLEYPLIDLRLSRQDCINIIARAGLTVPPKSSCYFCPFHSLTRWRQMRDDEPDLFAQSVQLERTLNERRAMLGKAPVWLTRKLISLDEAIGDATQDTFDLDGLDVCESGYCMT